ncbi:MAG: cyclic nucleotide-binding domain-containing protein [Anaerolineae bacterium]
MHDTKISIFNRASDYKQFKQGDVIFQRGDPAHEMYVVIDGEAEIHLMDNLTEVVAQGGFFGEMALISDEPRSATVTAKTDCKIVPVDEKRFNFMVSETPNFALTIMRVLVERLRRRNQHVADLLKTLNQEI